METALVENALEKEARGPNSSSSSIWYGATGDVDVNDDVDVTEV